MSETKKAVNPMETVLHVPQALLERAETLTDEELEAELRKLMREQYPLN